MRRLLRGARVARALRERSDAPILLVRSTLRGLAQVMLQKNAVTGFLFAIGIAIQSIPLALAALAGSLSGTLLARRLNFPSNEVGDGLYGFNGALVAIAAIVAHPRSVSGVLVGLGGVAVAAVLMRVMQKTALKPLTFPFVASTWLAYLLVPPSAAPASTAVSAGAVAVDGFFQAFGQVMLQANSITGLVFLAAILVNSRRSAAYAAVAAASAIVVGKLLDWPADRLATGIYGYNPVLAAIAISLVSRRALAPVVGVLLSIAVTHAMLAAGVPILTFPFVVSTWIVTACVEGNRRLPLMQRRGKP